MTASLLEGVSHVWLHSSRDTSRMAGIVERGPWYPPKMKTQRALGASPLGRSYKPGSLGGPEPEQHRCLLLPDTNRLSPHTLVYRVLVQLGKSNCRINS